MQAGDVAGIAIVKGEKPALDRTWMTLDDGSTCQVAINVIHDLPHLVVESLFGIQDGLWGVLARGGFSNANRAATLRRERRARLVTDAPPDELAAENWPGHRVAKAAVNAVVNRWRDGPDNASGVRARLEPDTHPAGQTARGSNHPADAEDYQHRIRTLLERLDDDIIELAITRIRQLHAAWTRLAPGQTLRLEWPIPPAYFADAER